MTNDISFGAAKLTKKKKRKKKGIREVRPDGPIDADVVILGEAPGRDEDRLGKPFVGRSGNLLFDGILGQEGFYRDECLVLNTVWTRPPFNNYDRIPQEKIDEDRERTWEVINKHPRKLIIPTGNHALRLLTGDTYLRDKKTHGVTVGIHKLRGSPLLSSHGHRVIPIIHPAALLREGQYKLRALCLLDAAKCRRWLDDKNRKTPVYEYTTWAGLQEAIYNDMLPRTHAFDTICERLDTYRRSPIISFDIETYPKGNPTITVIGITDHTRKGLSIPFTGELSIKQEVTIIKLLREILGGPALKVAQNVEFDAHFLAKLGIPVKNMWMDTMLAHSCLHPEMRHSLDVLVSIYTDQPYYKDMVKTTEWGNYTKTLWEYNVIDVCATLEVAYKLYRELQNTKSSFPYKEEFNAES